MNPIPLFRKDGSEVGVFFCENCKTVGTKERAETCCIKGICSVCGGETGLSYNSICYICRDKRQMEKAEKLESWDGPVVFNDGYFSSLGELLDCMDIEDLPEFVYIAETENIPTLDAEDILERLCEDLYEDAYDDLNGVDEFTKAVNDFNEANKNNTYWVESLKRAVRIPKENKNV